MTQTPTGLTLEVQPNRVVVCTFESENEKTGNMIQVWILHRWIAPPEAVRTGADAMVCGDCKYRAGNGCYVVTSFGPNSVWRAFWRGQYPHIDDLPHTVVESLFAGRKVRLGAYGDPAFISPETVSRLAAMSAGWTGYTHQWSRPFAEWLKPYVMASVDSEAEYEAARAAGWSTFRVVPSYGHMKGRERVCDSEHGVQCVDCGKCNGIAAKQRHIAIQAHGSAPVLNRTLFTIAAAATKTMAAGR